MSRAAFVLILVAGVGMAAWAQPQAQLIHSCDDTQGWRVNMGAPFPETKLEISTDARFVSEGRGCLHAATVSPKEAPGNTYLSLVLTTPPLNIEGKALCFEAGTSDAQLSRALYVRGYDAQGQTVLSWMSWGGPLKNEKSTFELVPGVSLGPLQWEPGVIKSDNRRAIVKWEFYVGTHEAGAPFDLYLDNIRLVPSEARSFMDVKEARPLYPETTIFQEGQWQLLLYGPAEADWQPVAAELQKGLQKLGGVEPPLRTGDEPQALQPPKTNVLLLGHVGNNRAMLYLYSHYMMTADGLFPGPGGYELRTISNPWGNGNKSNAIVIGASDVEGARAGVAAFLTAVKKAIETAGGGEGRPQKIVLPRLCEIKPAEEVKQRFAAFTATLDDKWLKEQQQSAQKALETGAHTGMFGRLSAVGEQYIVSGRDEYAQLFVWMARQAKQWRDSNPKTYGGPWGMDSDFMGHRVMPMWAAVEQSPALSTAERLEVSRILFQWIQEAAVPEGVGAAQTAAAGRSVSNHGTFAALAMYLAGEYYAKYYDSVEGKQWQQYGDQCFTHLAQHTKAHEDCNGYQWLTNVHILRYALSKPDLAVFENGQARIMANYALITMNNLGYQVPYGDTGEWKCWFSEMPLLRMAEWFYRDGAYRWAIDKKLPLRNSRPLWEYDPGGASREPTELAKFSVVPLDGIWHKSMGGEKSGVPLEKAFDKIAFRNSFNPQEAYLLLDGLSAGGHRHMDGNAVLQWTEKERVWLADADYIKALPKYHNGVLILKEGQSAPIPDFVELEQAADLPSAAISVTTYRHYAGVDWRRFVFWLKGRMFIVADQMIAREPGDYSFRAIWQTVGKAKLNGAAMDVEQGGQWARFATTADARVLLSEDPVTGANWASYPYADKPVVRVMQCVFNKVLQAGETFNLFTVLHASGTQPSSLKIARVRDNLAVISGEGDPVVVGLPDAQGRIALLGEAQGRLTAVLFTPHKGVALGVREARFMGLQEQFPEGADVELDLATGEAELHTPSRTQALMEQRIVRRQTDVRATAQEIQGFLRMIAATAPPAAPPATGAAAAPALQQRWAFAQKLDSYLLTNNAQAFEAVEAGLKLSCEPEPLSQNIFAADKTNTLDNLVDGVLLSTDGGVMWDVDQKVTINLELDNVYELQRLILQAWFATSSSKGRLFQLGQMEVWASDDGFRQDQRKLGELIDTEIHGNWGQPGYGPHRYEMPLAGKARQLRLVLTPRPGTALYLAELQLWGTRPGLALDMAQKYAAGLPTHRFQALHAADLNNDGQPELLAGSSNGFVYCFNADGHILWKADCGTAVNSIAAVDFAGNRQLTVVAGCMDSRLVALDAQGQQLWIFTPPFYKEPAHFRTVFAADLTGTGKQAVVAGADNWHYYAVDGQGHEIWRYESVHGATAGAAADLDGDKKDEIIASTEYYWWHVINPDGTRRFGYNVSGPTCNAVAAGDLDGDGTQEVLFGGADSQVHAVSAEGKRLWLFHTGDEVQALQTADVNGDGKAEVLVGSLSFNVYCLDGAGKMLWRRDWGSPVQALVVTKLANKLVCAVGCADGHIYVQEAATGQLLYQYAAQAKTLKMTACGNALAISTEDGNLHVLAAP